MPLRAGHGKHNLKFADYLARFEADKAAARTRPAAGKGAPQEGAALALNEGVARVAAAEPILRLPARIGLARIGDAGRWGGGGDIVLIPEAEASAWRALAERLGPGFGEFIPLDPLVARMLAGDGQPLGDPKFETIRKARLGAARQHLDAVLIYETGADSVSEGTVFSAANWTLIGAFILPGRENTGKGRAAATLIDVRNGYPYGSASTGAESANYSSFMGSNDGERRAVAQARSEAFARLLPEVEAMARRLAEGLARR